MWYAYRLMIYDKQSAWKVCDILNVIYPVYIIAGYQQMSGFLHWYMFTSSEHEEEGEKTCNIHHQQLWCSVTMVKRMVLTQVLVGPPHEKSGIYKGTNATLSGAPFHSRLTPILVLAAIGSQCSMRQTEVY